MGKGGLCYKDGYSVFFMAEIEGSPWSFLHGGEYEGYISFTIPVPQESAARSAYEEPHNSVDPEGVAHLLSRYDHFNLERTEVTYYK